MYLSVCTYKQTGKTYHRQHWRRCFTCFPNQEEGVCLVCAQLCHAGHNLGPIHQSDFFCDCGASGRCKCLGMPRRPTINPPPPPSWSMAPSAPWRVPQTNPQLPQTSFPPASTVGIPNGICNKLYRVLPSDKIYSPVSIDYALSIIQLGAKNNTLTELTNLLSRRLSITDLYKANTILNNKTTKLSNIMLINNNYTVNLDYINLVNKISIIGKENFNDRNNVAHKINGHVRSNTNGLIPEVISPMDIDNTMALILVNTIYFKDEWKHKFKRHHTKPHRFRSGIKGDVMVNMMYQKEHFRYYEDNDIQLLEMDYKSNNCMGVILPRTYNQQFNLNKIQTYIQRARDTEVHVHIPKFIHRKRISLNDTLQKMGVKDLFIPYVADLSGIGGDIFVGRVQHEAVVIVDEEGTEAAAFTSVDCFKNCISNPIVFKADRSFTYYIRDKTSNIILFMGCFHG